MKFNVHFKNELARDDVAIVEAANEAAAEALVMDQNPAAVATIDAYPAWVPAAAQQQEWAR